MRQSPPEVEKTRTALLDAAELLFRERGPTAASVLEIARTAGLTRGAFYHHFRDKAAVFEALVERARALDPPLPSVADGDEGDPIATLRRFCVGLFEHVLDDPHRLRMFAIVMQGPEALGDLEPLARERREEICRSSHAYRQLLERAHEAGRLAPQWTPMVAAATLYSTILGLLHQWLRDPDRFDGRGIGAACVAELIDAFEHRPGPAD